MGAASCEHSVCAAISYEALRGCMGTGYAMRVSRAHAPTVYLRAVWHLTGSTGIAPDNMCHAAKLDGEAEEDVITMLGEPVVRETMLKPASGADDTTPSYRICPVNWDEVDRKWLADQPCLINQDTVFHAKCHYDGRPSIPPRYWSPELLFGDEADFNSDLWALGCTLFEIRMGRSLFREQERNDANLYIKGIVDVFGELREPYWSRWRARDHFFHVDEAGRPDRSEELVIDG